MKVQNFATSCNKGYHPVATTQNTTFYCKTCAQINQGFKDDGNGNCAEICGDGLNLGQLQCDDGNNIDGDGCSSSCTDRIWIYMPNRQI